MKIAALILSTVGLTLAHAKPLDPVYTQDEYLTPAKQFLRAARLGSDEFALVLVSLVDREPPQIHTLKKWRIDELRRGVTFDASSEGVTFVGNFRANAEQNGDKDVVRIAGYVLLDVLAKLSPDGSSSDGIRAEARLDHPFAKRQIRIGGGGAMRVDGGFRTGVQLYFVRGG